MGVRQLIVNIETRLYIFSDDIMPDKKPFFQRVNLGEEALGGLSAGIVGTVIGFPLDVIKTRMHTGTTKGGMRGVASRIVRTEGIRSLYKGIRIASVGR